MVLDTNEKWYEIISVAPTGTAQRAEGWKQKDVRFKPFRPADVCHVLMFSNYKFKKHTTESTFR